MMSESAQDLLERLAYSVRYAHDSGGYWCPVCDGWWPRFAPETHKPGCPLAAAYQWLRGKKRE